MEENRALKVSVFGARGYTGLETCRLLLNHPLISSLQLVSSDTSWALEHDLLEARRTSVAISYITREEFSKSTPDRLANSLKDTFVFLACSATDAAELTPILLERGAKVIDLSGAHRLNQREAQSFYQIEHKSSFFWDERNYGLVPHQKVKGPLVSNPGCFVSSILMALIPLLHNKVIREDQIIIDSKSGTSGAGRSPKDITNFSEISDGIIPYKIGHHQHLPEIIRYANFFTEAKIEPRFTTTLIPIKRGILSTIYSELRSEMALQDVIEAFAHYYKDYPFVTVYGLGTHHKEDHKLALRNVLHTNQTQITLHLEGKKLTIFSMIDNLMKGAAGQALENFNSLLNIPLTTGFTV